MKSKKTILLILIIVASMIPEVRAITPQDQTVHITDTHDDMFITEVGIGIDSSLVTIKDPEMDIRAFLVFRELEINYWEPLKNATLRLHTSNTLSFDADSSITIYGMALSDLQREGWLLPSTVLSIGFTSAHTNYNTSEFYGGQWHEINVTDIVEELIRNPNWDGHGFLAPGSGGGDAIGFHIVGAEGYDKRYFYDYRVGNGLEAQLVLHWNHEATPPSGYEDAEYVEEHGNYTIWKIEGGEGYGLEPIEYIWGKGSGVPFEVLFTNISGVGPYLVNTTGIIQPTSSSNQRALTRTSNGTLYAVYETSPGASADTFIKRSHDEGVNWVNETLLSTGAIEDTGNEFPGIAVDSADGLHVVFFGGPGNEQIFYTSCAKDGDWTTPLDISTAPCTGIQNSPSIVIDSNDYIHVVWSGRSTEYPTNSQIYYSNYTDSWSTPLVLSTGSGRQNEYQTFPTIAVNSTDDLHVTWTGESTAYPTAKQLWHRPRVGTWGSIKRVVLYGIQGGYPQSHASLAIDSDDVLHAVFSSKAAGLTTHAQIWENNFTGSVWAVPIRLSTYTGMNIQVQGFPTIAIDANDTLYSVWQGNAEGHALPTDIWLANNSGGTWNTPILAYGVGQNEFPNLRWSRWPVEGVDTYLVVDANGTVLVDDLESLEDAEDWIDGVDPDPEDPAPPGWDETGPFTRFKTRLYIFLMGFGLLFGPLFYFAMSRPSGYEFVIGLFIMLIGYAFLKAAAYI